MTTVEFVLPDQLALDAQSAGLLNAVSIERMLREQIKSKQVDELFTAMDRMAAMDMPAAMTPEEVAEEIRAMRAERRAKSVN